MPLSSIARAIGRQIREATRCTCCGKCRVVLNTAGYRQRFVGEAVSPETHCTCAGGPAYRRPRPAPVIAPLDPTLCAFCQSNPPVHKGACQECC
jgi:hypothetical protein